MLVFSNSFPQASRFYLLEKMNSAKVPEKVPVPIFSKRFRPGLADLDFVCNRLFVLDAPATELVNNPYAKALRQVKERDTWVRQRVEKRVLCGKTNRADFMEGRVEVPWIDFWILIKTPRFSFKYCGENDQLVGHLRLNKNG